MGINCFDGLCNPFYIEKTDLQLLRRSQNVTTGRLNQSSRKFCALKPKSDSPIVENDNQPKQ